MYQDRIDIIETETPDNKMKVILILDPDVHRRGAISHLLDPGRFYALPLESLSELDQHFSMPDCILLADADGAVMNVIRFFARTRSLPPIIVYAPYVSLRRVVTAIRDGALDYIPYPFGRAELDRALAGTPTIVPHIDRKVRGEPSPLGGDAQIQFKPLTRREAEILRMVSEGASSKQISEALQISKRTVEVHRANILNKMDAQNSLDAVNIAKKLHII